MLVSRLNILTFLWLFVLMIFSLARIARGKENSIDFVMPVFFIFCGLPLLLEEFVGPLNYLNYPGFALASSDEQTNIVYCLYMILTPVVWFLISRSKRFAPQSLDLNISSKAKSRSLPAIGKPQKIFLVIVTFSPVLLVTISPAPAEYLQFSSILRERGGEFSEFHTSVGVACFLAIIAAGSLVTAVKPRIVGTWPRFHIWFFLIPLMFTLVWLHGKRNIIAILLVVMILALYERGVLRRGFKTYIFLSVSLLVLLGYSFFFQMYTNRVDTSLYENARIDYGRDDVIKLTIFSNLYPDELQILEYPGQSIVFYATALIPRAIWPEKPLPYAQYLTSAALLAQQPKLWGWGLTTSWLEEAIANFGKAGFLIGPLLIALVCRVGDASMSSHIRILTPLLAGSLLVVEAMAVAPLILLWVLFITREKFRKIILKRK